MSEERTVISTIRDDIDLNDQTLGLKIAAERLSIVRYVFLVQIEDGIEIGRASCRERGCKQA